MPQLHGSTIEGNQMCPNEQLTIGLVVRMSILDTKVDGSNPSINMFSP